ncbi:MAG TPA: capsular polysaccharide biosynthesis protein [Clostridiales bacterium]|nr:capsular polysaccharide biosynthesis protein [Clostridiales bacterium]
MFDFHSHILPQMDDGSRSVAESIGMLEVAAKQGVVAMAATPHYYRSRESIDRFLTRRAASHAALNEALIEDETAALPALRLGAEVAFFTEMSRDPALAELCIAGTDCLLVEMPFSEWGSHTVNEIYAILSNFDLTLVLAHVERYADFQNQSQRLFDLLDMGVYLQMNAEYIIASSSRRNALKFLKAGWPCLLGSDCHNLTSRKPNLGEAWQIVEAKLSRVQVAAMKNLVRL